MDNYGSQLRTLGLKYSTDKATHHGFCDFYQKRLPPPGKVARLLEIGVMHGNSLRMWRDYFGSDLFVNCEIVGVDIDLSRVHGETAYIDLRQLDATMPMDMEPLGSFDVIIDDGSHMTRDQQASFCWLYPRQLNPGGCYVMEDLHTSFMSNYVNTPFTTYDWLMQKRNDGYRIEFFHRDHADGSRSDTAIIFKDAP